MRIYRPPAALSLAAVAFLFAACDSGASSHSMHSPPPVAVELTTVEPSSIRDLIELVGQLEAEESVVLKSETEGVIQSVEFEEGQNVSRGTLLFHLRDAEQRARVQEAEAQLSLAADEYRRAKTLAEKSTVSQAELDRATANWEAAKARRDLARVELSRTEIRAPFDGALGARLVSPGDRIDTDTPLVQIDAVDRLRLVFTVPEMAIRAVRVGLPVTATVAPWPHEKFPGEVYFVAPSLDPRNRRLLLKGWVPNPEHKLRPGLFANIQVEIAHHDEALVVPESAIAYDAQGAFVWRVDAKNTASRAPVEIGIRHRGRVEVTSGLRAGDRIVSGGTHKVADGARVEMAASIVTPAPSPASEPQA